MRIVHVVAGLDPSDGGPSRSIPRLARELAVLGHEVSILYCRPSRFGEDVHAAMRAGVDIRRMPDRLGGSWTLGGAEPNGSVVHCHGLWSLGLHSAMKKAIQQRSAIFVSPRGMLEPVALKIHAWRKRVALVIYQRRDLERANAIHATSEQEASNLRLLGFSNIVMIPNGTDVILETATFSGPPTVLFLGRLHPIKGLPMLINAVAALRNEFTQRQWRVVIAGPSERGHKEELLRQVGRGGVGSLVQFVGELDGKAKESMLRSAHVFVLPSHSENFGLAVAEALGCGVPVITTTGTPWSDLQEHRCGWWVEPSVDGIRAALTEVLDAGPGALREMGHRGHALVAANYSWSAIAVRFSEAYREYARGEESGA